MQIWSVLHAAHGKIQDAKSRYLGTIAQLCRAMSLHLKHVSTIGTKLVKQQYLLHMYPKYGELRPTSGWDRFVSLGTPANFNVFHVLAFLLQQRRSTEANKTLHDVWSSPGLVHYLYIFGGSCPVTKFWQVENSLCVQDLRSSILAALLHGTPVVGISQTFAALSTGATYIWQGGHHVGHWPTF